jgi:hypothetical protein
MPVKGAVAQKEKSLKEPAKAHWQCMKCGSDFWGAKKNPHCPECKAEGFDLSELNANNIPIEDVKHVVSGDIDESYSSPNTILQNPKPKIDIDLSRAAINNADELSADMFQRDMEATIQDNYLSRMKAKAAVAKAEQIEGEQKVSALSTNPQEEGSAMPGMPNTNYLSASTLIQSISNLPEEERQWWLEQIKDPQAVYGLATLLNPPKQTMQGNTPFMQQMNPLMNLMGVKQQMAETPPPSQGSDETSSMLEMAEALKIMFEMAQSSIPPPVDPSESNKEIRDAMLELKDSQEKLNDRYMALRIEQAEGGGTGGVTKEDLEMIIDMKMQAVNKSPNDMIKELSSIISEVDSLRNTIQVKPTITEHVEPLDDWVKKHTMERELQSDQMSHESQIADNEAKKEKWKVARILLSEGIKENIKARTTEDEDKSDTKEVETTLPSTVRRSKVTLVK